MGALGGEVGGVAGAAAAEEGGAAGGGEGVRGGGGGGGGAVGADGDERLVLDELLGLLAGDVAFDEAGDVGEVELVAEGGEGLVVAGDLLHGEVLLLEEEAEHGLEERNTLEVELLEGLEQRLGLRLEGHLELLERGHLHLVRLVRVARQLLALGQPRAGLLQLLRRHGGVGLHPGVGRLGLAVRGPQLEVLLLGLDELLGLAAELAR